MFEALNYYDSLDTEELSPEPELGFVIDTPEKANWAVCKIKQARKRRDLFRSAAQAKMKHLQCKMQENEDRCNSETAFLLAALDEYIEKVPAKETKTQKTLSLPDGKLKKKFVSRVFKMDEEKLIEFLNDDDKYVKIIRSPAWGEFKKVLKEVNGRVVRMDTGEIVEGVTIEEKPETFDIE